MYSTCMTRSCTTILCSMLALFLGFLVGLGTSPAQAFNPQPDPPGFGVVSITGDQVAQLNVTNTYASDRSLVNEAALDPPEPSRVELLFLDAGGGMITRSTFTVAPGQTVSLPLAGARLTSGRNRAQIRAVVNILDYAVDHQTGAVLSDPFIATLELYDSQTGKTQVIVSPGTIHGFNPRE